MLSNNPFVQTWTDVNIGGSYPIIRYYPMATPLEASEESDIQNAVKLSSAPGFFQIDEFVNNQRSFYVTGVWGFAPLEAEAIWKIFGLMYVYDTFWEPRRNGWGSKFIVKTTWRNSCSLSVLLWDDLHFIVHCNGDALPPAKDAVIDLLEEIAAQFLRFRGVLFVCWRCLVKGHKWASDTKQRTLKRVYPYTRKDFTANYICSSPSSVSFCRNIEIKRRKPLRGR
jgi:hypothetical protein